MFEQLPMLNLTSAKRTALQAAHKKAGNESVEMGLLVNSFGTSIPDVFQKGGTRTGILQKANVAASYKDWDKGDGLSGEADAIEALCNIWDDQMDSGIAAQQVTAGFSDHGLVARGLASTMKLRSRGMWTTLRSWMMKLYNRLLAKAHVVP